MEENINVEGKDSCGFLFEVRELAQDVTEAWRWYRIVRSDRPITVKLNQLLRAGWGSCSSDHFVRFAEVPTWLGPATLVVWLRRLKIPEMELDGEMIITVIGGVVTGTILGYLCAPSDRLDPECFVPILCWTSSTIV